MQMATLFREYQQPFAAKYEERLLPSHSKAIAAIIRCRTPGAGTIHTHCTSCGRNEWHACSCGHRSCPQCQNHEVSCWLDRQREKLLPVDYFLVTFTLPAELRDLAWQHQRVIYDVLFKAATQTIKAFGLNPKHLGAQMGMTAVLHTHSRKLAYHPHIHVVVPGGGVDTKQSEWKRTGKKYLFNAFALAQVFRGKLLHEIARAGLKPPSDIPKKWVVDCRHAGRGESALEYLSRYLYRGVISESNIIANQDGRVTFRYTDGRSKETRTETLSGEDFIWRVIQHVLPRGFHRVRDYGFLHHNARKFLHLLQLILRVVIKPRPKKERPVFYCSACGQPVVVTGISRPNVGGRFNRRVMLSHAPPQVAVSDL
jgi:hypothetical protein